MNPSEEMQQHLVQYHTEPEWTCPRCGSHKSLIPSTISGKGGVEQWAVTVCPDCKEGIGGCRRIEGPITESAIAPTASGHA